MAQKTFEIKVADQAVSAALADLAQRAQNLRPAFVYLGERLLPMIDRRFSSETDWAGQPWKPNAPATLAAYIRGRGIGRAIKDKQGMPKTYANGTPMRHGLDKHGNLTKASESMAAKKKILQGLTNNLRQQNSYQASAQSLAVGNTMVYAAIQHLGGQAGKGLRVMLPARPFLPVDANGKLPPLVRDMVLNELLAYVVSGSP
ncbi:phage virion morphogenesis protein [Chitinimonas sp.]|uniref:phage virion morphogenesis protein n=1 Tax=Chitinimonas sp. TaxID=1934313 RepID=UPI0035B3CD13